MKVIFLFCIVLILLLSIRYILYFQTIHVYVPGEVYKAQTTLLSEPKTSDTTQSFRQEGLTIELPLYPEYHYGDRLSLEGVVEDGSFETQEGKEVVRLVVKNPSVMVLPTNPLIQSAAFLRNRVQGTFKAYLPKNESILLFGIVFGGSGGFDQDIQDAFRNSGVLHVVAASGMNVSMVAAFLLGVCERLFKRRTALFVTIFGVFYYALLSGFSASIVRASIMATIAFSAGVFGRQNYGFLALLITAFLMLMIKPETLFDVGFLLSFSATLGILIVKPLFDRVRLIQKTKAVSDDIGTTLSAQIGSLPVMAGVFGTYSWISIVVNALVLWTIPPLMILGGLAAFLALIFPPLALPALYLCFPFLLYFEKVILLFGRIPLLETGSVSWAFIVGYYLLVIGICIKLQKRGERT